MQICVGVILDGLGAVSLVCGGKGEEGGLTALVVASFADQLV